MTTENPNNSSGLVSTIKSSISKLMENKISSDFLWNFIALGLAGVLTILNNTIITNIRDFDAYGLYYQTYTIYIMISQIAVMGVHFSVLRGVSYNQGNPRKCAEIYSSGLILTIVTSSIATVILMSLRFKIAEFFDSEGIADSMKFILFGLIFLCSHKVLMNALNATRRMKAYAVMQFIRISTFVFSTIVILIMKLPDTHITLAMAISEFITFFSVFFYLHIKYHKFIINLNTIKQIPKHIIFGMKGFISGFLFNVNLRIDIVMIGYIFSDQITGIYSFASTIIEGVNEVTYIMRKNVDPVIGEFFSQNKREELHAFTNSIKKKFYLFMTALGIIAVAGFPALGVIRGYDQSFFTSWQVFGVLMIGVIAVSGYRPFFWILVQAGYPGTFTKLMIVTVLLNIVLNALLIAYFGIFGAAIATTINYIVQALLIIYLSRKMLHIRL